MGIRERLRDDLISCLSDLAKAKEAVKDGNPTEAQYNIDLCFHYLGKCLGTLDSVDELEQRLARLREKEEDDGLPSDIDDDRMYGENEPDWDETWDVARGFTQADGSIIVYWSTNDDEDRGYPSTDANSEYRCKDKEAFLKQWGKSRRGCVGCRVERYLDGEKI